MDAASPRGFPRQFRARRPTPLRVEHRRDVMKKLARLVLAGAGLAAVIGIGMTADAAPAPVLFSVVEGRDAASERPVLVLIGKSLTKLTSYEIVDPSGVHANATPEVLL